MANLQQTSTKLKLWFLPKFIYLAGGFSTLLLLLYLLKILSPLSPNNILTCERSQANQGICQLASSSKRVKTRIKTIALEQLRQAKVVIVPRGDGKTQYQQIVLLTKEGGIPLGFTRTEQPDMTAKKLNAIALQINNFLKNTKQSYLTIQQGTSWINWAFGSAIALNLLWLLYCSEFITWELDRSNGLRIQKRSWLFFSTDIQHPLQDIINVQLEEKSNKVWKTYRVKLFIAPNQTLPMDISYTNYCCNRENTEKIGNAIAQFLNQPKIVANITT
ncbi:MAG: hypothetical protein ACHBN1_05335 [Heteroscytonema crispum UTEX LB 1556]